MSDKFGAIAVVLEQDLDSEGIEHVMQALRLIRGVVSVKPVLGGIEALIAEERVRMEIRKKMIEVLLDRDKGILKL